MEETATDKNGRRSTHKNRLCVITGMPQYASKSLEELRFEDYTGQGRITIYLLT
jgi:hypothetical protein